MRRCFDDNHLSILVMQCEGRAVKECWIWCTGVSTSSAPADDLNEDPELAAALAASLAESLSTTQSCPQPQINEADLAAARLAALDPGPEPEKGPGESSSLRQAVSGTGSHYGHCVTFMNRTQIIWLFCRHDRSSIATARWGAHDAALQGVFTNTRRDQLLEMEGRGCAGLPPHPPVPSQGITLDAHSLCG